MSTPDGLSELDRRREELEDHVSKLRASLQRWQQWELEYEALKEELLTLPETCSEADLKALEQADDSTSDLFAEELLTPEEMRTLFYDAQNNMKPAKDIIRQLSSRVDYVQRNIRSTVSLLAAADQKFGASRANTRREDLQNEEGLPVTEIQEVLDEDGNVVSSSISKTENDAPQLMQALRHAGVNGLPDTNEDDTVRPSQQKADPSDRPVKDKKRVADGDVEMTDDTAQSPLEPLFSRDSEAFTSDTSDTSPNRRTRRPPRPAKRVSFAEDTKSEPDIYDHPQTWRKWEKENLLREFCSHVCRDLGEGRGVSGFFSTKTTPKWTDTQFKATAETLLKVPTGRQARRLLKFYNLKLWQASTVLCEMTRSNQYDLDNKRMTAFIKDTKLSSPNGPWESDSDHSSTGDALEKPANPSIDSVMHKNDVTSPDSNVPRDEPAEDAILRREMLEYNMNEVGAIVAEMDLDADENEDEDDDDDGDLDFLDDIDSEEGEEEDDHGRLTSRVLSGDYIAEMRALEKKMKGGFIVNVGPDSPILSETNRRSNSPQNELHEGKISTPMDTDSKPEKSVRFAETLDIADTSQLGSENLPPQQMKMDNTKAEKKPPINAADIIERPYDPSIKPAEPDELDPSLMQRQMNDQYHHLRNRMIGREGGFLKADEPAEVSLEAAAQAETGKKMSRFKAARLGVR